MDSYANRFGAALTVYYTLTLIQTNKGGIQVTAKQGSSNHVAFFFILRRNGENIQEFVIYSCLYKGDVTQDDSQRQCLAQHIVAMLEQCCDYSKQCRNNVATLCCAKNSLRESPRVTSP